MTHDPPAHKPFEGGVGAYMTDVAEHLTELNTDMKDVRWRMHRGEPDRVLDAVVEMRRHARKLMSALEMVKHCLEKEHDEP